jgi:hypothetical protein
VYWSRAYIGSTHRDKFLRKGIDDESPLVDVAVCRDFHSAPVLAIASCARKPLMATCTGEDGDASVRIWHYRAHRCVVHHRLEKGKRPTSVAFHPSGSPHFPPAHG